MYTIYIPKMKLKLIVSIEKRSKAALKRSKREQEGAYGSTG